MLHKGFPGGLNGKETPAMKETWVQSLGWENPLGKGMAAYSSFWPGEFHKHRSLEQRRQPHPTPALLPGKSHGRRSLVGCSPWGHWESDTTERLHFHALVKEMATHSSVLAWRIPGTAEPGGLPSMGLHRVGHDWSDLAAAAGGAWRVTAHEIAKNQIQQSN